jgi:hypothetical protein
MSKLGFAEFIIILVVFGTILSILIFLAWYFTNRAKAKDKQFLIEKGININDPNFSSPFQFSWLKVGIVVIGISLSLFLLLMLEKFASIGSTLGFAIILLFAGISMVVANFIGKSNGKGK